jgi:hypothetical protein
MASVNQFQVDSSSIRVPNLYKRLGIANNIALKPPLPKDPSQVGKKTPRRQTLFVPTQEETIRNFQRMNTFQSGQRRNSASALKVEMLRPLNQEQRTSTPKSRFIQNFVQHLKEKENDRTQY